MAQILLLDLDEAGIFMGTAYKASLFGHKVRIFIPESKELNPNLGKGFANIQLINNWVASVKWADLIMISDVKKFLPKLDALKKAGVPIYAPSAKSSKLEVDRKLGMDFLKKHGIDVPPYHQFNTLKEAEQFQWKNDKRYVFKPLGDEEDKAMTYCSKSPEDMISTLQRWQKMGKVNGQPVMLQEFIPGIEFAVAKCMTKNGYIGPALESFEHKPLMNDDIGPGTGEMGTVQKYVDSSKAFDETMKVLEKDLVSLGHLGNIDVNSIVDEKGKIWPLEFTARCGWPQWNIMLSQCIGDPMKWMIDAVAGKDTMNVSKDVAIGVVLTQPPFPSSNETWEEVEKPFFTDNDTVKKHVIPQSMMIGSYPRNVDGKLVVKKDWMTCGTYFAIVTALGNTVEQAQNRVYKTIDKINVSSMMYRTDIGDRVIKKLPDLQKLGYAKDWNTDKGTKQ
jgi:phosphoribosylamine--glycine ligase